MTRATNRWRTIAALLTAACVLTMVALARAATSQGVTRVPQSYGAVADTGTLSFEVELAVTYPPAPCPAGTSEVVECFARTGKGVIRGLGSVNESHVYLLENLPAGCNVEAVRLLPTTARLSVPGKGEIEFHVGGTGCLLRVGGVLQAKESFTVTGGSGRYAGATGSGTISHVSYGPDAWRGRDTWAGTLVVPGLDFDLTAPTLAGASNRTIRAPMRLKRVRVAYSVRAQDAVDGALPVTCRPKSRSWFLIGRTRVRCAATDTSGNECTAAFVVTVRRGRYEDRPQLAAPSSTPVARCLNVGPCPSSVSPCGAAGVELRLQPSRVVARGGTAGGRRHRERGKRAADECGDFQRDPASRERKAPPSGAPEEDEVGAPVILEAAVFVGWLRHRSAG